MTIERARIIAASVRRKCAWSDRVLAGHRDDDDAVQSALAAIRFMEATVRCNMCGWHGEEADLVMANDSQDGELTNACPNCLTDHYLMDLPDPGGPSTPNAVAGPQPSADGSTQNAG